MGARDEILARIRSATGAAPSTVEIPRGYRRRGELRTEELLDLLQDRLLDYKATVHRCSAQDAPAVIGSVVDGLIPAGGPVLVPPLLPRGWAPAEATVDDGALTPTELDRFELVLTGCVAAAAETGTIVLDGGAGQGRRAITLVPDRHVCVVRADQVVQTVPELLARLDPRLPLTFVSGPSATSDIELQRVEGVHGPRTLVVILVVD